MVARMLKSLKSLHVDVRCSSDVVELIFEKARVAGVCTVIATERSTLHASGGVILATGGLANNEAMIRRWVPFADPHVAVGSPDNVGAGVSPGRSKARRVGKECVGTCRDGCESYHQKTKQ